MKMEEKIRYAIAAVACFAEGIAYVFIGVLLGWKHGGGVIPGLILFAIWGVTWTAITKWGTQTEASEQPKEDEEETKIPSDNPGD